MNPAVGPEGYKLLGLFRFALAASVVLFHLWNSAFPDAGRNAVAGFFCISGFLVTMICNEVYVDRPLAFLANRFLRIYPTFWTCVLLIVVANLFYPDFTVSSVGWILWPKNAVAWIDQLSILNLATGLIPNSNGLLIPQAWSLQVELMFYLIIGLGTARYFSLTLGFFFVFLIYAVLGLLDIVPVNFYWSSLGSGFMFYLGSLAYFLSSRWRVPAAGVWAGLLMYAASMYLLPLTIFNPQDPDSMKVLNLFIVLSAGASFIVLVSLPKVTIGRFISGKVANYLGKLSYPIFLIHSSIAIPVASLVQSTDGPVLFLVAFLCTLFISALIIELVEKPIEAFRKSIRSTAGN